MKWSWSLYEAQWSEIYNVQILNMILNTRRHCSVQILLLLYIDRDREQGVESLGRYCTYTSWQLWTSFAPILSWVGQYWNRGWHRYFAAILSLWTTLHQIRLKCRDLYFDIRGFTESFFLLAKWDDYKGGWWNDNYNGNRNNTERNKEWSRGI